MLYRKERSSWDIKYFATDKNLPWARGESENQPEKLAEKKLPEKSWGKIMNFYKVFWKSSDNIYRNGNKEVLYPRRGDRYENKSIYSGTAAL